jgi:hypothetical protein
MRVADDCRRCLARNDGMNGAYCFHAAFAQRFPGDGRPIPGYPQTPKWCPGMVRDKPAAPRCGRWLGSAEGVRSA